MNPRNLMKSYLCAFCDDEFAQNSDVNDHISKVHAKEIGGIENEANDDVNHNQDELVKTYKHQRKSKPQSRLLPCDFCDREFILEETLKEHMTSDHSATVAKLLECQICSKKFTLATSFNFHVQNAHCETNQSKEKHTQNSTPSNGSPHMVGSLFKCHICDKKFMFESSLKSHCKKAHQGSNVDESKKYLSKELPISFINQENPIRSEPEKSSKNQSTSSVINIIEPGNAPVVTIIEPLFVQPLAIGEVVIETESVSNIGNNSVKSLSNPKPLLPPYQCHFCKQRFQCVNIDMVQHVENCEKTGTLKCQYCEETFGKSLDLTTHINKNHFAAILRKGIKYTKFGCELCGKDLADFPLLKAHLTVKHQDTYIFECPHCHLKETSHHNLKYHVFKRHVNPKYSENSKNEPHEVQKTENPPNDANIEVVKNHEIKVIDEFDSKCLNAQWKFEPFSLKTLSLQVLRQTKVNIASERYRKLKANIPEPSENTDEDEIEFATKIKEIYKKSIEDLPIGVKQNLLIQRLQINAISNYFSQGKSKLAKQEIVCDSCGKFLDQVEVVEMGNQCKDCSYMCDICYLPSRNSKFLKIHKITIHSKEKKYLKEPQKLAKPTMFQCKTCDKSFWHKKLLDLHMNTHLAPKLKDVSVSKPPEVMKKASNITEPTVKLSEAPKNVEAPKQMVKSSNSVQNVPKVSKNMEQSIPEVSESSGTSEPSMEDRRRNQIHAVSEYFRKLREEANKPIVETPIIDMAIPTNVKKDTIDDKSDTESKVVKRKRVKNDFKENSVKRKHKVKIEPKGKFSIQST